MMKPRRFCDADHWDIERAEKRYVGLNETKRAMDDSKRISKATRCCGADEDFLRRFDVVAEA